MRFTRNSRSSVSLIAFGLYLLGNVIAHASTYTWDSSITSGNWSTLSNWTTTPATGGPGSSDTVNLNDLATSGTYTITYDASAPSTVGTIILYTTNSSLTVTLSLAQSLTVNTEVTLYSTNGSSSIQLTGASNLTIASGATLTLGEATATSLKAKSYITQGTGYTGNGLILNGTLLVTGATSSTMFTPTIDTSVTLNSGGTINLDAESSYGNRLTISGNFTANSGSTIKATGSSSSGIAASGIYFTGSSITIGSGVTISGFPSTIASSGIVFSATSSTTQTISLGTLFNFTLRDSYAGSSSSQSITTQVVSSSITSGSVSNSIYKIILLTTGAYTTQTLKLGSNLNWVYDSSTSTIPLSFSLNSTSQTNTGFIVDLNGYTYDMTTSAGSFTIGFTPTISNSTVGSNTLYINNTGTSSISGENGIFRAAYFTLSNSDVGIGSGVILQATATGVTNTLSTIASGITSISASSTFYYTGSGTASLYSSRSIGKLIVGTSAGSSSILKFTSSITTNGTSTINGGSILDLNGNSLVLGINSTVGASLITSGTTASIQNSSTTSASINFTSATTAGEISPGGNGQVGSLALNGNSGNITLNLANSETYIDISSSTSYDKIVLSGNTTINYSGSIIYLNFLTDTYTNGIIDLFSISGTYTTDGETPTIISNMSGTFNFDSATGDITFSLIPEPSTILLSILGLLIMLRLNFFSKKTVSTSNSKIPTRA